MRPQGSDARLWRNGGAAVLPGGCLQAAARAAAHPCRVRCLFWRRPQRGPHRHRLLRPATGGWVVFVRSRIDTRILISVSRLIPGSGKTSLNNSLSSHKGLSAIYFNIAEEDCDPLMPDIPSDWHDTRASHRHPTNILVSMCGRLQPIPLSWELRFQKCNRPRQGLPRFVRQHMLWQLRNLACT